MARFMVMHRLAESPDAQSTEDVREARRNLYQNLKGTNVQWLRGWWLYESAQQLCEYEAPSESAIRQAIEASGVSKVLPIVSIEEVLLTGPNDIPGEFEN